MKLKDLAQVIRSKNAGPFWLTIDIMFEEKDTYERVKATGVLNARLMGELYSVPEENVRFFEYDPAYSFKASILRTLPGGSIGDSDVWGAQQHAPLLEINIPAL